MDRAGFISEAAGKVQQTTQGYNAFIPNPLPRSFTLSPPIIKLESSASIVLGRLDGMGYLLPNPDLLIAPYTRIEALASSRIEGTQASLSELFYFEAASDEAATMDILEVRNYLQALNHGLNLLKRLPLSLRFIREIHRVLMTGVRGGTPDKTPGEFRKSQNWIGSVGAGLHEATFVPPPPATLLAHLDDLEKYLHDDSVVLPIVVRCAFIHYQFEVIHPFLDGNGRVGRLLIIFFLIHTGVLKAPLLYLSAYFEKHRTEYYTRLMAVSQAGDWEGWLHFFLHGVIEQAQEASESAQHILDYREALRVKFPNSKLIDLIFKQPYLSARQIEMELNISFNAAQKHITQLEAEQVLVEVTGKQRYRVYAAHQLLKILKETDLYKR